RFIIPRQTIRGGPGMPKRAYGETFQREHRAIVQAIRSGGVLQARAAMRRHLVNSRKRDQRLAAKLGRREGMQTILITGAAGGIGTRLRQLLKGIYPNIRLSDVRRPADLTSDETFVEADLANMAQVETAVAGVQAIVHLGGFSVEGSWDTILQ